jgi:hypothetical protein
MANLISSRYEQGFAAYRAGQNVAYLVEVSNEIDERYDELNVAIGKASQTPSAEARNRIGDERDALRTGEYGADAMPSLIAGFVDGFLADFRKLVAPDVRPAGPR